MNTKTLLKALGYAILTLLVVNLIYFIIELNTTNLSNEWSFAFKHGTFKINEQLIGLKLWSSKANGLMILVFSVTLFKEYRKGNLKLNKK
jgi:hypothetical protein